MSPAGGPFKRRSWGEYLIGLVLVTCVGYDDIHAADLDLSAGVGVSQRLSDNIANSATDKQSEWISEVTPRFGAKAAGRHLTLSMDYQIQDVRYANNTGSDQQLHQLSLGANVSAWNNQLNFDIGITHSQQQIDEQGTTSSTAVSLTNNTTNVGTVSLAPKLEFRLFDRANLTVQPSYGEVAFQTANNAGGANYGLTTSLASIPRASLFSWGVTHSYSEDTGSKATFGSLTFRLGMRVGPKTDVFASLGREGNDFATSKSTTDGSIWDIGANWRVGSRTKLSASIGNRFFSRTYLLEFSHAMRHMNFSLSYNQNLTTTTALQLGEPVFDDTGSVLLGFGVPVESKEVFVVENLQASLTGSYSKSSFGLNLSMQDRSAQVTLVDDTTWTMTATASHAFSGVMSASAALTTRSSKFSGSGLESDFTNMSFSLSRVFSNDMSLSLNGARQSQRTNTGASDFTENRVSITVGWTL